MTKLESELIKAIWPKQYITKDPVGVMKNLALYAFTHNIQGEAVEKLRIYMQLFEMEEYHRGDMLDSAVENKYQYMKTHTTKITDIKVVTEV